MNISNDVWKWIAAVLVAVVISMGGYIWSIEGLIKAAVTDEINKAMAANLEPLRVRVSQLELSYTEARREHRAAEDRINKIESSLASIDARLAGIAQTQGRIIVQLERIER